MFESRNNYQQDFLSVHGTFDLETENITQYMGLHQKPLKAINEIIFCSREAVFFVWPMRINGGGNSVAQSFGIHKNR